MNHPLGRYNGAAMRVRAKLRVAPEPVLRRSLRQAALEVHRLVSEIDMMGEVEIDFVRTTPESVDLYMVGEEKPIRVFGVTDQEEGP
jgi:hypothetical protein